MLALASAWCGLTMCALALVMAFYSPAFNDWTLPIVLYGSVVAIGCGGLVLMRRKRPDDVADAVAAQAVQAKVGIGLGMAAVIVVYALFSLAKPLVGRG
ncbi:MAG: hypothetical protein HUU22_16770 [Phycisphaerae bacterium]|nr:hypothetical protein [Phycisphaerae bacterium]NUQ47674.1 hypothetical protein [Phycisphaerae bacterium]